MNKMNTQQGFTLIELIVVIVILGILAVTAAPKFISFTNDARAATLHGLKGSIQGAMQLVYSKSLIEGEEANATGSASSINTVYGYPQAAKADVDAAAGISSATDDSAEYTIIVNTTPTPNVVYYYPASIYNGTTPLAAGTVEAGDCYVKYTAATSAIVIATVSSVTSGCDS
jgi:MSHA pilin protein MshA